MTSKLNIILHKVGVACAVAGIAAAFMAVPCLALAQVLDVGEDGAVTVFDGPAGLPTAPPAAARSAVHAPAAIVAAAQRAALSPALIAAVAWRESGFRSGLTSRAGAIGEMQLMPGTARAVGVDPRNSADNYRGGAAYLRALMSRYHGDLTLSLAAYNAGPGAVDRYGGVPPFKETRAYVAAIYDRLSRDAANPPAPQPPAVQSKTSKGASK